MSIYVYVLTARQKLITWKCQDRMEARIVISNLSRSSLISKEQPLGVSYSVDQPWLTKEGRVKSKQFITYESNKSYYYPWAKGEGRV